jgi:hypothetical protein
MTTVTNQNYVKEGIKRKLNPRNACCHSVEPKECLLPFSPESFVFPLAIKKYKE